MVDIDPNAIKDTLQGLTIGSPKLLRLLYIKKLENDLVVSNGTTEVLIESLNDLMPAFYDWDAHLTDASAAVDVYKGVGAIMSPGIGFASGIHTNILKRRRTGAASQLLDVFFIINNNTGVTHTLHFVVYRKAGLK